MGGMGLSHPLQDTPLSRNPHTDTYFYKFTIITLRSKSKIPLKVHELEGVIMQSKTKRGTEHWQNYFLFFSQTVLNFF